jgi:hypothetical protein
MNKPLIPLVMFIATIMTDKNRIVAPTWLMDYGSLGYASRDGLTRWQVLETLRLEASPQVYVDEQAAEQLMRLVD